MNAHMPPPGRAASQAEAAQHGPLLVAGIELQGYQREILDSVEALASAVRAGDWRAAEASERRSQQENRTVAIRRLRLSLALGHRTRALAGPSPLWLSRVQGGRLVIATTHDDYPALVAEALDQLAAHGLEMPPTAVALGVTPSQLAGLFRKEPQAWTVLNRLRTAAGLPALRARP